MSVANLPVSLSVKNCENRHKSVTFGEVTGKSSCLVFLTRGVEVERKSINRAVYFSHCTQSGWNRQRVGCSVMQKVTGRFSMKFERIEKLQGGPKNWTIFRLDNFVTVSPRKACSMSKFSKFYGEKGTKFAF